MSTSSTARGRATIRDVAALAGVGIKTVSRVINDEANVSAPMRERVQSAVMALNFQPHQGAGALRRRDQKTRTLGLPHLRCCRHWRSLPVRRTLHHRRSGPARPLRPGQGR